MVCKSLIQHSRDTTGFNWPCSVIESVGRKGWWFIFKNKEEGGELKESSWRVMGLGNEKGRKEMFPLNSGGSFHAAKPTQSERFFLFLLNVEE